MASTKRASGRAKTKGQDYVTVLTDIDGSRVVEVAPGRTESAAELVLRSLTDQQRRGVKAIAADMLPAYANAAAKHLPNAELVHDRFHVAKHLGEAVDKVRRAENKALIAADDDRLKGRPPTDLALQQKEGPSGFGVGKGRFRRSRK